MPETRGKSVRQFFRRRTNTATDTSALHGNESGERIAAFISIPRNASNSTRDILGLGPNRDYDSTKSLVVHENHQRAAVLARKYDLDILFVFCFARHPYDRCVSWYEFHKEIEPYRSVTFAQWVQIGMPHHFHVQNETDYRREGISPLLQYNFVEGCQPDFVGKIETFDHDMRIVVDRLNGLRADQGIDHRFRFTRRRRNTSARLANQECYFTTETKAIVRDLLARDFECFGYEP